MEGLVNMEDDKDVKQPQKAMRPPPTEMSGAEWDDVIDAEWNLYIDPAGDKVQKETAAAEALMLRRALQILCLTSKLKIDEVKQALETARSLA